MIEREEVEQKITHLLHGCNRHEHGTCSTSACFRANGWDGKSAPITVEAKCTDLQTVEMLCTLLAERDAAFKAGEDAMRKRAADMIERAGKGTNSQVVTDVMGVAVRALANQPPVKGW